MVETQTLAEVGLERALPSFSIIVETENLINADLEGLSRSLSSLLSQDVPPTQAKEVVIIDNGAAPAEVIAQMQTQFPWLKVHQAPVGTGYYESKMLGARLVTGEIVVYCDSDCIYEPQWLGTILTSFDQPDIQVVAGETRTRGPAEGLDVYGAAMALVYIFPPYSRQQQSAPTQQYFLNNVAFRRQFLLAHPIPLELPLYRGNCVLHARSLIQKGYQLWRQPQARACHAPPYGLSHFFWRFLLIGHDYYWQKQLLASEDQDKGNYRDPISNQKNELQVFVDRLRKLIADDPRYLLFFPLSIPLMLVALLLIGAGYLITQFKPGYLLPTYTKLLA